MELGTAHNYAAIGGDGIGIGIGAADIVDIDHAGALRPAEGILSRVASKIRVPDHHAAVGGDAIGPEPYEPPKLPRSTMPVACVQRKASYVLLPAR